ncbi:uncharacterized protein TM35_000191810 [Trypanosoma theileri]|uniref:Uncharacterized protein n=1 Tax=Trypanosoma theileri TaxID=67003 RepID=A0A1X0NT95_9TRYP|nr:uncharacterized protein TM35_000191810 [Trypanosoma theileri]ORC87937.1 hypothetical protein TM35_000191810 [Trypanosoma theileri]
MQDQGFLQQEESDAALARQLHQEINGPDGSANPSKSETNPNRTQGGITLECPACTFINSYNDIVPGVRYTCEQCHTPLSLASTQNPSVLSTNEKKLVKCNLCECLNKIPNGTYDAILCGGCSHELKKGQTQNNSQPQQSHSETTRRIQVRCGECGSVNAVQVGNDVFNVRFECGSCQVVNEVSLQ